MPELIRVTDHRAASRDRAFPRDPSAANPGNGPAGTVGPDAPLTTYGAPGDPPVVIEEEDLAVAFPTHPLAHPQPWAGWPADWTPSWSTAGGVGPREITQRVSTVFSCTDLNARALSSMPVEITENGRPADPGVYPWVENPEPKLYADWSEFVTQWVVSMSTRGEAFIHATAWDARTLAPTGFMVLDPDRVTVAFDETGVRRYSLNGEDITYTPDLLHTRYMTLAGYPNGMSPLQGAAGNLRSAGALERYGADLAERGGLTWGVLTSENRLTHRQAEHARNEWVRSSMDRRGAPAVLGNGLKLDTLTLSPRDMALLDLRVFDEQRIAAAMGVPPFLIGLRQPEGLTYANATSLFDFHYRGLLRPLARKLTGPLSNWLLPRSRKIHLRAGDYIQPPLAERTNSYREMNQAGVLTVDEWRALEGLPPAEHKLAEASASPYAQVGLPALIDAGIISRAEARQLLGLDASTSTAAALTAKVTAGSATLQ